MNQIEQRIERKELLPKIASAKTAAAIIKDGMTVAVGGYTSSGYPKAVARELVERKKAGEAFQIRLLSGANNGHLDTMLAQEELISWRAPMIESKVIAKQVNDGKVHYVEQQMNKMPRLVTTGAFGMIDVAIVEALKITEDGYVVPTSSIGIMPQLLEMAKVVIVEINTAQPLTLDGMHDVYLPEAPPNRKPIPLTGTSDKIGTTYVKLDPNKIQYIVHSEELDMTTPLAESKEQTIRIAENLVAFLIEEAPKFPGGKLPPIQTGFGNLASEIVKGLDRSGMTEIEFFCGGLHEASMEMIAKGKVKSASTGSIQMTPRVIELLESQPELFREKVTIRNADLTNNAETIGRLGLVTLNSGVEMDIYGNVNSSHIAGSKVVNGLGGGANFAENAGLSVVLMPSENKGGAISTIVPMVSHHDILEHDIDIVVTENGVADLRGKDDVERARAIIENCSGPNFKDKLTDYLDRAIKECGGHHPQLLEEVFQWHIRLKETGSMK